MGSNAAESTIKFAIAVFRHGIRAPIKLPYPNNPNKDYDKYFPLGLDELTKIGKERIFEVGKIIRHRYYKLLGDFYKPNIVKFYSTGVERTMMSAQLVSNAIYPPKTYQKWGENQTWQPIPIWTDYGNIDKQNLFFDRNTCQRYWQLRDESKEKLNATDIQKLYKPLSELTGSLLQAPIDLLYLWDTLFCEDFNGLKLPKWTKKYYPNILRDVNNKVLKSWVADTPEMLSITTGTFLHFIKSSFLSKANNTLKPNRNMILFGGHDSSLVGLINGIGNTDTLEQYPGSTLVFELHEIDNKHIIKAFYLDTVNQDDKFHEISISNCDKPCTLESFVTSIRSLDQNEWMKKCP